MGATSWGPLEGLGQGLRVLRGQPGNQGDWPLGCRFKTGVQIFCPQPKLRQNPELKETSPCPARVLQTQSQGLVLTDPMRRARSDQDNVVFILVTNEEKAETPVGKW